MDTVERIEPLSRRRAAEVADAELTAFQDVVSTLDGPDWDRPTESAGWSVRDIVAHVAGQYEELARLGTFLRRLRIAKRRYPDRIALDRHNQVQIDELAGRSPAELTAHLARFGPKGLAAVRRTPGLVRRLPSTMFFPEPPLPDRRMSYLFDVLTARDTWMHRLELVRATGQQWRPHPHDADIVAQVVRDLDKDWRGKPIEQPLTATTNNAAHHSATDAVAGGRALNQATLPCVPASDPPSTRGTRAGTGSQPTDHRGSAADTDELCNRLPTDRRHQQGREPEPPQGLVPRVVCSDQYGRPIPWSARTCS